MDPTGEPDTSASPDDALPVRFVTVNDVVAMNLAHFRRAAGLSQQDLANRVGWLKSVVATAERSWAGRRSRNFTADDLVEIARGLGLPLAALLLPPEDDGIAVTYMVDGLHGSAPWPLRDLVPVAMGEFTFAGESAAGKEFRRRLFATERYRSYRPVLQDAQDPTSKRSEQRVRSAREFIQSIAEEAVAAAGGDPADIGQVVHKATRRADSELALLLNRHEQLEREVNELRAFEREYRRRLLEQIENQVRGYWSGVEGVDPEKVLGAMREQVARGQRITVLPVAQEGKSPGEMLDEERERAFEAMQELVDRGVPGPFIAELGPGGAITVKSATVGEALHNEGEAAHAGENTSEGERLPAVLLPRP